MRIVNSQYGLMALGVGALLLVVWPPVRAQSQTVTQTAVAASATMQAVTAAPPPSLSAGVPVPSLGAERAGNADGKSGNAPLPTLAGQLTIVGANDTLQETSESADAETEDRKFPSQVKAVVKKLQEAKVDLSLEDMNQARAALVRLDLLLELEQKMSDLDKARAKRSGSDLADDVSALLPRGVTRMAGQGGAMPVAVPPAIMPPVTPVVIRPQNSAPTTYTVKTINGIGGNYTAVLHNASDEKTTVRVGDKLPDGATVTGITAHAVQIRDADTKTDHTLRINTNFPMSHGHGVP